MDDELEVEVPDFCGKCGGCLQAGQCTCDGDGEDEDPGFWVHDSDMEARG